MAGLVFISYDREDRAYVEDLVVYLTAAGLEVWWDSRIGTGERFARELERGLDECTALVLVLSPRSVASSWVDLELHHALNRNKPIYPLMLEMCPVPFHVGNLHWEDVQDRSMPGDELVTRLGGIPGTGDGDWSEDDFRRLERDPKPACRRVTRILDALAERPDHAVSLTELTELTGYTRGELAGAFAGLTFACRSWWPDLPVQGIWPIRSQYGEAWKPDSGRAGENYYTLSAGNAKRWKQVRSPHGGD